MACVIMKLGQTAYHFSHSLVKWHQIEMFILSIIPAPVFSPGGL